MQAHDVDADADELPKPSFKIPGQREEVDEDAFLQWLCDQDVQKRQRVHPLQCDNPNRVDLLLKRVNMRRLVAEAAYKIMIRAHHDMRMGKGNSKSMEDLAERLREEADADDEDDDDSDEIDWLDRAYEYVDAQPNEDCGVYEDKFTCDNYSDTISCLTGFDWEDDDIVRIRDACDGNDPAAFCNVFEQLLQAGLDDVLERTRDARGL